VTDFDHLLRELDAQDRRSAEFLRALDERKRRDVLERWWRAQGVREIDRAVDAYASTSGPILAPSPFQRAFAEAMAERALEIQADRVRREQEKRRQQRTALNFAKAVQEQLAASGLELPESSASEQDPEPPLSPAEALRRMFASRPDQTPERN
jgi:hypothetical protein